MAVEKVTLGQGPEARRRMLLGPLLQNHNLLMKGLRTEPHNSDNDTDVGSVASTSASASQNKNTKKLKVVGNLSPEEEQSMVEWLEAHLIIYNKKSTSYKETTKKKRKKKMWIEKTVLIV